MSDYAPDEATACEDMCRFLSACFYEPCKEFAEEHLFDSMLAAATQIHPELADVARKLGAAFSQEDLQALLVDYTRLFLGPVQALAKPYGSCWLRAPEQADASFSSPVLELYSAGGFEIAEEFRELPDHVAVELEFMYLLTFRRNEAQRSGEIDTLWSVEELERRFLNEHLGVWIGPFADAIKSGAETPFYRHLAELTERFVRMEKARLGGVH